MTKIMTAGLAGVALAFAALTAPAFADAPAKPSVETTTIADLVANPKTNAVLEKDWPVVKQAPLDQVGTQTLRALAAYPQAGLDDAKLKQIQADFDAATK
jgi:hypothetical protein